ncbi:MAG TPA: DUF507 family protein [Candidatus Limnocylindria bacterium]|nr:DUF507 family protein [Candidatus Limnocylindria bacterium]
MRPPTALIERFATVLVKRLAAAEFVDLLAPENKIRERVVRILTENFAEEARLEAEAEEQAEKLIRQGAPGMRREDLDLRRVQLLVKQRLAKERGFVL